VKTSSFFLLTFLILASFNFHCDSDSQALTGKWKLVERLMDPGDGSGTFQAVSSDKTIEFFNNGTFKSNGTICVPGDPGTDQPSAGTFDVNTGEIIVNDCQSRPVHFRIEGHYLILSFLCIEPCSEKYINSDFQETPGQ
jgi:hypothetical protein